MLIVDHFEGTTIVDHIVASLRETIAENVLIHDFPIDCLAY